MKDKITEFFKEAWGYIKEAKFELIMLFGFLVLDLLSKSIIDGSMSLYDSVTLIPKLLHFTYIHNDAAAFGSAFGIDKLKGSKRSRGSPFQTPRNIRLRCGRKTNR